MSKKFTFITYHVQNGEYENYEHYSFLTSDFQKMNEQQLVAYFFECNYKTKLTRIEKNDNVFWLNDMMRTAYVYSTRTINLTEHELLEQLGILKGKPHLLFSRVNNIIQLKRKVG
jgi:hypothetical protein